MSGELCNVEVRQQGVVEREAEMSEVKNAEGLEVCPDCESEITDSNSLIDDCYNPEAYGYCVNCYDPTPAGPEYSVGFEMNH